jgi:hypothetical protein
MAGAGFSGKDGTVKIASTDVAEIRNWKFNPKSNNPKYASNKTSGYKRTVAGVKEASGSMSGAWDHSIDFLAVVDVGTSVTLKLYTDLTHFFSVPSVIDDCSINVDVDNGEIVSWDSNFSANGAWANPAAPMFAPQGFGVAQGSSGNPEATPEAKSSPFSAEQLAMISATAAQAAMAAMQAMFSEMNKTNPAQKSEPVDTVASEPGGTDPTADKTDPKTVPVSAKEHREKNRLPKP